MNDVKGGNEKGRPKAARFCHEPDTAGALWVPLPQRHRHAKRDEETGANAPYDR
jgi:hypothetical protein